MQHRCVCDYVCVHVFNVIRQARSEAGAGEHGMPPGVGRDQCSTSVCVFTCVCVRVFDVIRQARSKAGAGEHGMPSSAGRHQCSTGACVCILVLMRCMVACGCVGAML